MANLQDRKWSSDRPGSRSPLTSLPPRRMGRPPSGPRCCSRCRTQRPVKELPSLCRRKLRTGGQVMAQPGGWGRGVLCHSLFLFPLFLSSVSPFPRVPTSLTVCPHVSHTDTADPRVASNDSDSELEEGSALQSPAGGDARHRLSLLEHQGSEASVEEVEDSGDEEQLGASAGEDGAWEGLSQYNSNHSNNVAAGRRPALWPRGGQVPGWDRRPEFV